MMSNQRDELLKYLRENNGITRPDSFYKLGMTNLSSRIMELEQEGHCFWRDKVTVIALNGRECSTMRYSLVKS